MASLERFDFEFNPIMAFSAEGEEWQAGMLDFIIDGEVTGQTASIHNEYQDVTVFAIPKEIDANTNEILSVDFHYQPGKEGAPFKDLPIGARSALFSLFNDHATNQGYTVSTSAEQSFFPDMPDIAPDLNANDSQQYSQYFAEDDEHKYAFSSRFRMEHEGVNWEFGLVRQVDKKGQPTGFFPALRNLDEDFTFVANEIQLDPESKNVQGMQFGTIPPSPEMNFTQLPQTVRMAWLGVIDEFIQSRGGILSQELKDGLSQEFESAKDMQAKDIKETPISEAEIQTIEDLSVDHFNKWINRLTQIELSEDALKGKPITDLEIEALSQLDIDAEAEGLTKEVRASLRKDAAAGEPISPAEIAMTDEDSIAREWVNLNEAEEKRAAAEAQHEAFMAQFKPVHEDDEHTFRFKKEYHGMEVDGQYWQLGIVRIDNKDGQGNTYAPAVQNLRTKQVSFLNIAIVDPEKREINGVGYYNAPSEDGPEFSELPEKIRGGMASLLNAMAHQNRLSVNEKLAENLMLSKEDLTAMMQLTGGQGITSEMEVPEPQNEVKLYKSQYPSAPTSDLTKDEIELFVEFGEEYTEQEAAKLAREHFREEVSSQNHRKHYRAADEAMGKMMTYEDLAETPPTHAERIEAERAEAETLERYNGLS